MLDTSGSFAKVSEHAEKLAPEALLHALAEPFGDDARVWLTSGPDGDNPNWKGRAYRLERLPEFDEDRNWCTFRVGAV